MELSREMRSTTGLLYPMMIIAAIAVTVFSIIGIASIVGWMPHAMVGGRTAVAAQTTHVPAMQASESETVTPTFQCAECGVIQSVREIERRGSLWTTPVAAVEDVALPVTTGL
jgi:outer membrane lipoprotein SlyB